MIEKKTFLFTLTFIISLFLPAFAQQEEHITITTYYPSPYGSYNEMRAKRIAIGDNYVGSTYCWPPNTCLNQISADADLVVEGRVGVGTTKPGSDLEIMRSSNESDNAVPAIILRNYVDASMEADLGTLYRWLVGPKVLGLRAVGTPDARIPAKNQDLLLGLEGQGYDGSNFFSGAMINMIASEDWTSSSRGANIIFKATPQGYNVLNNVATMGYTGPHSFLTVASSGNDTFPNGGNAVIIAEAVANNGAPLFRGIAGKGTKTAPLPLTNGTILMGLQGGGYYIGGSGNAVWSGENAGIYIRTAQDWSTGNLGSRIVFYTVPNGGAGSSGRQRMDISDTGSVGIGDSFVANPNYKLDVAGTVNAQDYYKNGVPFGGGKVYVGVTSGSYDGYGVGTYYGLTTYNGADKRCKDLTGDSSARMCFAGDFVNGRPNANCWYNTFAFDTGIPGSDCLGWQSNNGTFSGPIWNWGGGANQYPDTSPCNASWPICCCK